AWAGDDSDRPRLQSGRGAFPSVDAGRLRRRAHAGDGAIFRGTEGRSVCVVAAYFRDGSGGYAFLVLGILGARGADDVRREPGRAGADQRQAAAGVQLDCARRLHYGGVCGGYVHGTQRSGGSSASLRRGPFLFAQLRAGETGGIHHRFATGRSGRKESFAGRLCWAFAAAAVGGSGTERLPAFAARAAGDGGLFRTVLHLQGGGEFATAVLRCDDVD